MAMVSKINVQRHMDVAFKVLIFLAL